MQFSVVVPTYNRSGIVLSAVRSLQRQTFADFECIIVDDGSTDVCELRELVLGLNDTRFTLIEQSNQGGGAARNTGILAAKGEWIAFLDSDDEFLDEKLESVRDAIETSPGYDVYTHYSRVVRDGDTFFIRPTRCLATGEDVASFMFCEREFLQTSTLVVRAAPARLVLFNPSLRKAQDVDFVVRLQRAGCKFFFIERVLSIWTDLAVNGRVGSPKKPESVLAWYNSQKKHFSQKICYAFEGSYLAYEISDSRPIRATFLIGRAFLSGAIGGRIAVMSFLRVHLRPEIYRYIVNRILKKRSPDRDE